MSLAITRARALVAGGALLGAAASPARGQQTAATLRVAIIPIENSAQVYYAKDMGFFGEARLDVDIQTIQTSGGIAAALVSGASDIGNVATDTLATVHDKHVPLIVIAGAAEYLSPQTERIWGIVVPMSSPVHGAKDLNGKVVATPAVHAFATTVMSAWIDRNGGDSSTVKFAEIPFPAIPAALDAGRVDAAGLTEPFLSVATKTNRVLVYPLDAISKHFIVGTWVTTAQWAVQHPDLVERYAAAMREAAVWANKNPQKSGEILAKYTKIAPELIAIMARARYAEQPLTPSLMQPLIDASAKYNDFSSFPAQELIYTPPR